MCSNFFEIIANVVHAVPIEFVFHVRLMFELHYKTFFFSSFLSSQDHRTQVSWTVQLSNRHTKRKEYKHKKDEETKSSLRKEINKRIDKKNTTTLWDAGSPSLSLFRFTRWEWFVIIIAVVFFIRCFSSFLLWIVFVERKKCAQI